MNSRVLHFYEKKNWTNISRFNSIYIYFFLIDKYLFTYKFQQFDVFVDIKFEFVIDNRYVYCSNFSLFANSIFDIFSLFTNQMISTISLMRKIIISSISKSNIDIHFIYHHHIHANVSIVNVLKQIARKFVTNARNDMYEQMIYSQITSFKRNRLKQNNTNIFRKKNKKNANAKKSLLFTMFHKTIQYVQFDVSTFFVKTYSKNFNRLFDEWNNFVAIVIFVKNVIVFLKYWNKLFEKKQQSQIWKTMKKQYRIWKINYINVCFVHCWLIKCNKLCNYEIDIISTKFLNSLLNFWFQYTKNKIYKSNRHYKKIATYKKKSISKISIVLKTNILIKILLTFLIISRKKNVSFCLKRKN